MCPEHLIDFVIIYMYYILQRTTPVYTTNAKAVIMLLTSILICVNVHYFWSFDLVSFTIAPGEPRQSSCTFTQNELRQSVFFQKKVWPALDLVVAQLLPIGSLTVCSVVMVICLARGRHRGTALYRCWRQRYTLEPDGVEQLVWINVNVCLMTLCLTVPQAVVDVVQDVAEHSDVSDEFRQRVALIAPVCIQAYYCCLSLKIFVYIASSTRFRHELRSIFHLGVK